MSQTVEEKVLDGNPWYTDDQYQNQLGTLGARWVLEGRWGLFGELIDSWLQLISRKQTNISVLDAGCGDGINGAVLKKLLCERGVGNEIVGCDYNTFRLERVKTKTYERIIEADLLRLPFKDNEFDLVLCSHVLEHISRDENALREIKRILKPGGLLILAVPNEGCFIATLRNKFIQRSILRTTDHVHFYTRKKLLSLTQKVGLEPVTVVLREGIFMPHLGISTRIREYFWGRKLLDIASILFPSQSAGLQIGLTK